MASLSLRARPPPPPPRKPPTPALLPAGRPDGEHPLCDATARPIGADLTRALLSAKLQGQAAVLAEQGQPELAERIGWLSSTLAAAPDSPTLRMIEAQAAALYWQAL